MEERQRDIMNGEKKKQHFTVSCYFCLQLQPKMNLLRYLNLLFHKKAEKQLEQNNLQTTHRQALLHKSKVGG